MKPTPRIPQIMHRELRIVHWNKLRIAPRAAQLCIVHCALSLLRSLNAAHVRHNRSKLRFCPHLIAALCIALLASCQQDPLSPLDNLLPPDGEIRITASVNNPSPFEGSRGAVTRAGADNENLNHFGLYIDNPDAKYSYDNELIRKVSGVWTRCNPNTAAPLDAPLLWSSANQKVTVTAYFPHSRSEQIEDGVITNSVHIDQTLPEQIWISDLLWAQSAVTPSDPDDNNDIHYNTSTKSLVVQMNHVLSKLRVNIRYGSSLMPDSPSTPTQNTAPTLGDVTLSGTRTDYNFTPANGKVALHPTFTSPYDIKMYHEPASAVTPGQHATCEAIIVPQTAAFSVKIVADGKTYTYTHPTTSGTDGYTFESDKIYILNLVVGKDAVTLGSVTVKEWSKDTTLPDGNATPAPFTDPNFVDALKDLGVPTDAAGRIDPTNADTRTALEDITSLNVSDKGIKSLRGIEYLTRLTELYCQSNSLTALDVSQNKALTTLICGINSLTALDVSDCTVLIYLYCNKNSLTALDVSQNKALTTLSCDTNSLTALDVSDCTVLTYLNCNNNSLTALDVGQNKALTALYCESNRLTTLDITAFTNDLKFFNCGDQKADNGNTRTLTLTLMPAQETNIEALGDIGTYVTLDTYIPFSDPEFVAVLTAAPHDVPLTEGKINLTAPATLEALGRIETLDVRDNTSITNLRGIEYLTGLTTLLVERCTKLTTLDVRGLTKLTQLTTDDCIALTTLNVSGCTALTHLRCDELALTTLNVRGCTALTQLNCSNNRLTALDVRGCTALIGLHCMSNPTLITLNANGCEALTRLNCNDCTALATLDVGGCTALTQLYTDGCIALTTLNANGCEALTELSYNGSTALATLNVRGCKALTQLDCSELALTSLNVRGCEALTVLSCNDNRLTTLDVSSLTKLTVLYCNDNRLTTLDVSSLTKLIELYCSGNRLTTLDITALPASMDAFTCGNQQDGRRLTLLLREDQQAMWNEVSDYSNNAQVTTQVNGQ